MKKASKGEEDKEDRKSRKKRKKRVKERAREKVKDSEGYWKGVTGEVKDK